MSQNQARIIDGKALAAAICKEVADECERMVGAGLRRPKLCVIIVGENPASKVYVRNKRKACEDCGIDSVTVELPEDTSREVLLDTVNRMNADSGVDGILVQLPLPKGLDEEEIIAAISPEKDVDCFHPSNVGRVYIGNPVFLPCTPAGIVELLKYAGVELCGKRCVVVGRSNIVGKPVAALLMAENATVTIAHSKTTDLKSVTKEADILVAAIGKAKFFNSEYIKPGAAVIDVGMDRDEDGRLCGDVYFEDAVSVCGPITPVPGGVGPMTVAMLMKNTLKAAKLHLT
ncbi:MAG: bifunctional methylenetetrahydrofolate dehydrogenase/methenyltetrahydrofolate cyclohydrolase FolD [Clostridia bacterium]|nr:bifunctional methylenetetrahydrofolate dehydrogenase/methenyltetrahydrofolate cyclohydrolase FolD [Clostridia bacterium]